MNIQKASAEDRERVLAMLADPDNYIDGGMVQNFKRIAKLVEQGGSPIGLSCSERITAALLANRLDWLPSAYPHVLDAIDRLDGGMFRLIRAYRRKN